MQIKDVCRRTGLTERAVRFYIEKELLSPEKTWRNGREYLNFSEKDLCALNLSGDSAEVVWNGAVYDHPYPMAYLQIFLPNRWKKSAGLTGTTDLNALIEAALRGPQARVDFVRLEGFQGEER